MGREARHKLERQHESGKVIFGSYLVAFLDLVGQTDELRRMMTIPHDGNHFPEVIEGLRRTAGRVKTVRDAFNNYLIRASENRFVPSSISPAYQVRLREMGRPKITQHGFSDCFVITTPIFGETDLTLIRFGGQVDYAV